MADSLKEWRLHRFSNEGPDSFRADLERGDPVTVTDRVERYEYGRDYDRLLYSSAFRKLGGVTQVVSSSRELGDFHNRLTHSLKVAQTGVRLAWWLSQRSSERERSFINSHGGLHPSVVRAACLAHDFGHPPFGHIGEAALEQICQNPAEHIPRYPAQGQPLPDGFEGNAQTFRIVSRLSFRQAALDSSGPEPALNLTRATLAAISKYPWPRSSHLAAVKMNKKWGAYESEAGLLAEVLEGMSSPRDTTLYGRQHVETRTIEAQIMDLADDIAYAVHDIEDFYRAGLIPLHELAKYGTEFNDFTEAAFAKLAQKDALPQRFDTHSQLVTEHEVDLHDVRQVLRDFKSSSGAEGVFAAVPHHPYDGSRIHRRAVHAFASDLITATTAGLVVNEAGVVSYRDQSLHLVLEVLKQLTDHYVVQRAALGSAQFGQRKMLVELVSSLYEWTLLDKGRSGGDKLQNLYFPARLGDYFDINVALSGISDDGTDGKIDDVAGASIMLRTVIDYVASLTDEQARAWHDRICLGRGSSMLDRWLFI